MTIKDIQIDLQKVLFLSGNPYESLKSHDETMDDICRAFALTTLFRRNLINFSK